MIVIIGDKNHCYHASPNNSTTSYKTNHACRIIMWAFRIDVTCDKRSHAQLAAEIVSFFFVSSV